MNYVGIFGFKSGGLPGAETAGSDSVQRKAPERRMRTGASHGEKVCLAAGYASRCVKVLKP